MQEGKRWEIPAEMHPPIEQGVIVLKDAGNKKAARAFLRLVKSKAGQAILEKYGFAFPRAGSMSASFF
jgi:molybdate transport system substrate-binding protein